MAERVERAKSWRNLVCSVDRSEEQYVMAADRERFGVAFRSGEDVGAE